MAASSSDVPEEVLGDDHVELGGIGHELHRGVVHEQVLQAGTSGNSSACTRVTVSRHSLEVSITLALSTLVTLVRAERKATRAMRSTSATV